MSSPYSSELRKVTEREKPFMEKLNSDDQNLQWEAICEIRNAIVGNRRQKANFIVMGIIHHLTTIIRAPASPDGLKRDAITLMTSLSKGSGNNIIAMCDYGAYQIIIDVLMDSRDQLLLSALRCMLSIISSIHANHSTQADQRTLQTRHVTIVKFDSPAVLARLIAILEERHDSAPHDDIVIASLSILKKMARLSKHFLDEHHDQARHLLRRVCSFLAQTNGPADGDVQLLAIQLLVRWLERANATISGQEVSDNGAIFALLSSSLASFDHHDDFQIAICRALVLMFHHRTEPLHETGIVLVRCLASLCSSANPDTRIQAAHSLARLLDNRIPLQQLAFYSHQLAKKVLKFFQLPKAGCTASQSQVKKFTKELNAYARLRCAGLTLLAALTRDDERLRTAVLAQRVTPSLQILTKESWAMTALVEALTEQQDPNDPGARSVLRASLKCLQSFSRSDQHLRTTIQDYEVYDHFIRLFEQHKQDDELMVELLPILANFMLFFCPSKNEFIQLYLADLMSMLMSGETKVEIASLVLACMINLCHQSETISTRDKDQIIQHITIRDFYELTERHNTVPHITQQILALFRNLVDDNPVLVESKGDELLKVLKFWLNQQLVESGSDKRLLCGIGAVLRNISAIPDGVTKLFSSDELIKLIVALFQHPDLMARTQASYIIANLLRHNDESFIHRQKVLRAAGLLTAIHKSAVESVRPVNTSKLSENVEHILKRLGEI